MSEQKSLKSVGYGLTRKLAWSAAVMSTALTSVAHANVVGSPFQNFNPTSGSRDYVTVESSNTLGSGEYSLGLFLNQSTNSLPYAKGSDGANQQSRSHINDSVLASDLAIGVGLIDRLDVGLVIPMVLSQNASSDDDHGQFAKNGVTEYRITTKLKLLRGEVVGLALTGSANVNQTNDNPYAGAGGGPAYNIQLIGDVALGKMNVATNLGYRMANSGSGNDEVPIQPFGDQYIGSVALSYDLTEKWQGIFEVYGGQSVRNETDFSERESGSAEALIGAKYRFSKDLVAHVGGGTELQHGTSTPDWRFYTGISWTNGIKRNAPAKTQIAEEPAPAVVAPAPQPETVVIVSDILFGFNSSRLVQKGTFKNLENLIKMVTSKPDLDRLTIEGHTCNIGNDKYNRDLSQRRAESIKELLVKKYNIPASKIQAIGYGESKPITTNNTKEGRAKNRRVEFKIYRKPVTPTSDELISKK